MVPTLQHHSSAISPNAMYPQTYHGKASTTVYNLTEAVVNSGCSIGDAGAVQRLRQYSQDSDDRSTAKAIQSPVAKAPKWCQGTIQKLQEKWTKKTPTTQPPTESMAQVYLPRSSLQFFQNFRMMPSSS